LPGVDGLRRAEFGAEAEESAGLWLSTREVQLAQGSRKSKRARGHTFDGGEDLVDSLASEAVAKDDGVFARLGRVDERSHGECECWGKTMFG
jgi:hypothetical protein